MVFGWLKDLVDLGRPGQGKLSKRFCPHCGFDRSLGIPHTPGAAGCYPPRKQNPPLYRPPLTRNSQPYGPISPAAAPRYTTGNYDSESRYTPTPAIVLKTMDLPMRRLNPWDRDYNIYRDKFNSGWLHPGKTGEVQAIWLASRSDLRGSQRARRFANAIHRQGGGMFVTRFHGTQRACHVGEGSGDITPCSKPECRVCGILKHGFQLKYANSGGMFGPGIYSTTASSKADIYAKNHHVRTNRHVILICRLAGDRPQLLNAAEPSRRSPDANYNCVEAVTTANGGKVQYPETVVYDEDCIIPVGLIVYKRTGWEP